MGYIELGRTGEVPEQKKQNFIGANANSVPGKQGPPNPEAICCRYNGEIKVIMPCA
jgi:hypothetical protein